MLIHVHRGYVRNGAFTVMVQIIAKYDTIILDIFEIEFLTLELSCTGSEMGNNIYN